MFFERTRISEVSAAGYAGDGHPQPMPHVLTGVSTVSDSPAANAPASAADVDSAAGAPATQDKAPRKLALIVGICAVLILLAIAGAWRFTPLHEVADAKRIGDWLHGFRNSPWTPLMVIVIYVASNAVFFPNTILNTATILGLGPLMGLPSALAGSMTAAMLTYWLGRRYGKDKLQKFDIKAIDRVSKMLKNSGVLGIATLRLLPIAPYGVVNLVAGAARVRPFAFLGGTFLGLLPGNLLVTAFGHQLRSVLRNPSKMQIAAMVAILAVAGAGAWYARRRALAAA